MATKTMLTRTGFAVVAFAASLRFVTQKCIEIVNKSGQREYDIGHSI